MQQKTFNLSETTVNAVLNYLATKPYQEVKPLFDRITQELQPKPQPVPAPETAKEA